MNTLDGKTAIVTGAAGGIGRGIAQRLARDGANVVINDIGDPTGANEVVKSIEADGGTAIAVMADVTNSDDVNRLMNETVAAFGTIDILVNNAGAPLGAPIDEVDEKLWDASHTLNLKAPFFLTQAALRHMPGKEGDEPGKGGSIVMMSSSTTMFPMAGTSPYVAAKTGQKALTDVLALELGPRGIRVNAVMPGPTLPGQFTAAPREVRDHAASLSPFNRIGHPDDIASVVAFLVSDDARWVTGQHLLVNGGATI